MVLEGPAFEGIAVLLKSIVDNAEEAAEDDGTALGCTLALSALMISAA